MTGCIVLLGLALTCPTEAMPGDFAAEPGSGKAPPMTLQDVPTDRWVAEDKLQHFAMSFAVTAMAYGGARLALDADVARPAAAGVAVTLGVGKELADVRRGGPFSLKDLAWDIAGVALGYTLTQRIP